MSAVPDAYPRLPIAPGSYQQQFPYYGAYPYAHFKENVERVNRTFHPGYMVPGGPGGPQTPFPAVSPNGRVFNDPHTNFFNNFLNTINSWFWPQPHFLLPDIRAYGFQYSRANSVNFLPGRPTRIPRQYNNRPSPPPPQPYVNFGTHYPWVVPQNLKGMYYRY